MLPRVYERIRDSVHQLLADRVEALGVSDQFIIERASIRHRNGSEFVFSGLRYNATRIKSMENISVAMDRGSGHDQRLQPVHPCSDHPGAEQRDMGQLEPGA